MKILVNTFYDFEIELIENEIVVLSIKSEQQLPIKLIGVGEKIEDLQDFNAKDFAKALFSSN